MFASHSLAVRIEAAEARLCAAVAAPIAGSWTVELGGGMAIYARPGSPVNKLVGLGFRPLEEQALIELEARGPVRVELSTLADPAVAQLVSARGYRLEGFENVLAQRLPVAAAPSPPRGGIEITAGEQDELWGEVAVEGFAHPDETSENAEAFPREVIEQVMQDFARASGFHRYFAMFDGKAAGVASVRFDDDIAVLSGATTLPWARRRGVQGALLARRLADAAAAGCEVAVMVTSPGTQSQANAHRHGFEVAYARAVLTKG